MVKILPREITSYDLLKTFAVIMMVADHIGVYFFPDQLWWRAAGRMSFPVWLFLIGYARSRDLPPKLFIGAIVLLAANVVVGLPVLPLNILFTIILVRMALDRVMRFAFKDPQNLWKVSAFLFLLMLPSYFLCEYGTLGLIMAIYGYLVRHRDYIGHERRILHYMIFALFSFVAMQQVDFSFSSAQFMVMALGSALVWVYLYGFELKVHTRLTQNLPAAAVFFCRFCGRRTLEIYVAHLLLFKALAVWYGMKDFGFFDWRWI